jgi:hypothetical protein
MAVLSAPRTRWPSATGAGDVLDVLRRQHAMLDELFDELKCGGNHSRAVALELAARLIAHSAASQAAFYPAVMRDETAPLVKTSLAELEAIDRGVGQLLEIDPLLERRKFELKVAVLHRLVAWHAHDEEEQRLFPLVRALVPEPVRRAIAEDYRAHFDAGMHAHLA